MGLFKQSKFISLNEFPGTSVYHKEVMMVRGRATCYINPQAKCWKPLYPTVACRAAGSMKIKK